MRIELLSVMVLALVLTIGGTATAEVLYTVTDLGTIGTWSTHPTGINNAGKVVGYEDDGAGRCHGFLWQNGTMTPIGSLPGTPYSLASGINNLGQIVGESGPVNGGGRAFIWQNGVMGELVNPSGGAAGARGINDAGIAVGYADGESGRRPCRWENGVMTDLGSLGGTKPGYADSINGLGHIVGLSPTATSDAHAFLWRDGAMTDLGVLGAQEVSEAIGINDWDDVVGISHVPYGLDRAFLWTGGVMTELGTIVGSTGAHAIAINNQRTIVGSSRVSDGAWHACIWDDNKPTDLNNLILPNSGWVLQYASGINDAGWIIADGVNQHGEVHAFLLTPEPATLALLALGGMALMRRQRIRGCNR